jgi:hypothetical protein
MLPMITTLPLQASLAVAGLSSMAFTEYLMLKYVPTLCPESVAD